MAKKVQFTTNQPSASTDYLAADNTWKTIPGGGGGTTWGSITGTLSSQTDLQTALDAKMNIATYDTDVDGVVDSAERIQIVVRNSTGSTLTKGQIVYLSGATGNRPNALLAQANTEATSSKTIGMVMANIANNSDGQIAVNGTLHDIDTSSFTAGDSLWLSATTAGGVVANTPPAEPNHSVFIGYVARAHPTQGRVVLAIQNGYELDELHGVQITSVANNDILKYNSSNSLWENSNVLSTKQDTITLTTTGTSGSSTLVGSTLNIPVYAGAGSGTSIQTITGVATGLNAATTRYNTVNGSTSESQVSIPLASAITINNLYVRTTATMPVNSSLQVTIVKNAVATSVSVTIAAGSAAGIYSDTTNNATFSAGDRYQIEFKNTGSAVAAPTSGQSFKITI